MSSDSSAPVFDIKRFALHDGPGIRTTGFLKGCPLSCVWCQNPEGIEADRLLWYTDTQCIRCGRCMEACPEDALSKSDDGGRFILIDRDRCNRCGDCVEACPTGALHWDSRSYTVEELAEQLMRDAVFYESSGGGVTLSGGEPTARPDFSVEVLRRCRGGGFHTAVETTLFASRAVVERFLAVTDLFLADLKLIDDEAHRKYTGVGNDAILENIRYVASSECSMVIRTPLIPGITDTDANITGIAAFVAGLEGESPLELLNFNPLAESKYRSLDRSYRFADTLTQLPEERMERLRELARKEGCRVI